jgi:hypothetical protein
MIHCWVHLIWRRPHQVRRLPTQPAVEAVAIGKTTKIYVLHVRSQKPSPAILAMLLSHLVEQRIILLSGNTGKGAPHETHTHSTIFGPAVAAMLC